ncbi:MAG: AMP-binding protein [Thermodesulfobacteriota bacterium]|nr:AMP-binding protein [Thermodesulfobacteriota bacterium]
MREDTLPTLFQSRVLKYGDRVALRDKNYGIWDEISWNQYNDHIKNFCLGLIHLGLERDDKVSIIGENCPEWLYADLAVQTAGAISVGVYPTNPPHQVKYILEHSESKFVVVEDQEQLDKVLEIKNELPLLQKAIVIDMKGLRKYTDPIIMSFEEVEELGNELHKKKSDFYQGLLNETNPEDVALMVYTSGTTGPPKGAMLTHQNIINMIKSFVLICPIYETDEVVSYLPLCHIAERVFSVVVPLYTGCTVNFAENVNTVQDALKEIYPTVFLGVPRIWEKMHSNIIIKMQDATYFKRLLYKLCIPIGYRVVELRMAKKRVNFMWKVLYMLAYLFMYRALKFELGLLRTRIAASGAAPISPEILKYFHAIGMKVIEAYGMTEGTGIATVTRVNDIKLGTVGIPIPGVEIKIAEDGEILERSDLIFAGYFKDPQATETIKRDGWLHTGDVGCIDKDGHLRIEDRKKAIIITSGGKNIAPSEMENRLKFSPYINEAVVIGDGRKYLTALIQIEYENVAKWAQDNNIAYTTFKSLAQSPEVYDLIFKEVQKANKEFASVETIKKFTLLDKELDHDDDELTATLKVRRKAIDEKFGDAIETMYRGKK